MEPARRTPARAGRALLLATVFLTGTVVMVVEMAAVRAVAPYLGASNYIWTNVIGVMLGALAVGYFLGGRAADRWPRPVTLFCLVLLAGVICSLMPYGIRPLARWLVPADLGLETAAVQVYQASLIATLVLFAPPALVLGGVSPLAIKLLASPDRVGGAAGQVFAISTVGSIVGTFATTLYLIPWLGTRATIIVAGLTLCGAALLGLLACASSVLLKSSAALGVGVGLVLLLALGGGEIKASPDQVMEEETAYQYVRVRDVTDEWGRSVRMLQINEAEESYQSVRIPGSVLTDGRYYDYYAVLPLLLGAPERKDLNVLVLGLAAGTIPMQLRHFYPEGLKVTGVEIDPGVVELGRKYFDLPAEGESSWLDVRIADGRLYLDSLPLAESLDLVIIDAFAKEYYIPFHLATSEAFAAARDRLRPGGILGINVSAYSSRDLLLDHLEQTMASVFGGAYRVEVDGYANYMIFAVKDRPAPLGRLAQPSSSPARGWSSVVSIARYVAANAARVRAPEDDSRVLTDDRAPVEKLTDELVRRESRAALGE